MSKTFNHPLAEQLRPTKIEEVIGQSHLLGTGKPLYNAFTSKELHSMILWGPPGVGKTTIAQLMATVFDCEWIALSAVFSGVKEIRMAVETAKKFASLQRKTILFIDEIHRFNKSQQDALLPYTESGLIILIGSTTENPSFEINSALISRTQVYHLTLLNEEELGALLKRAQEKVLKHLKFDKEAIKLLIEYADGDGRRLLNFLEQINRSAQIKITKKITVDIVRDALIHQPRRFDKGGDDFYDQISALHKSVRGSNPDAALYWFCRMLDGGVNVEYLVRRIIRMAWEDVGLADPRAMQIVNEAANTYERLGSPEGELALAEALLYLAIAPKSNAGYVAFNEAMVFVKQDQSRQVPIHLRNAPTKLMKKFGHGKNYRYPHDEPHGYAAGVQYFPEGISEQKWYRPTDRGLEIKIAEKLNFLKNILKR